MNVALLTFTPCAQINTITDYTTSGTGLSSEQYSYDANLRATGASATWLSASGSSGGTQTDNQSFCYDALSRLIWAGNTGTPTGGDHCGNTPRHHPAHLPAVLQL